MKGVHSGEALRTVLACNRPPEEFPASCTHSLGGLVFLKGLGETSWYQSHSASGNAEPTLVARRCEIKADERDH